MQGVTFKNGRVGVNFGGYEAEAGLGGILTGNAADGGLSASAKTPFGQQAGAGLGGRVDGKYMRLFSHYKCIQASISLWVAQDLIEFHFPTKLQNKKNCSHVN